jgi:hypothetical protein
MMHDARKVLQLTGKVLHEKYCMTFPPTASSATGTFLDSLLHLGLGQATPRPIMQGRSPTYNATEK